jgi:hypothetical protein
VPDSIIEAFQGAPFNPRRALLPWGSGRFAATGGSGVLIQGQGCITYNEAYETTGSAAAAATFYDGTSANGQVLFDYTLSEGESTSEMFGMHWLQFVEGIYVHTGTGSMAGSVHVWVDHDCAAYNGALFHLSLWAKAQFEVNLATAYAR